jgi:hypothetical protein
LRRVADDEIQILQGTTRRRVFRLYPAQGLGRAGVAKLRCGGMSLAALGTGKEFPEGPPALQ